MSADDKVETALPLFVRPAEIEPLKDFETDLIRIEDHLSSTNANFLDSQSDKARELYQATPTDENWFAFRRAERLRQDAGRGLMNRFPAAAEVARTKTLEAVVKLAVPIVMRGLQEVRERFEQVKLTEEKRHQKRIGRPLGHSEIIAVANEPVARLEGILNDVKQLPSSSSWRPIFSFLRAHVVEEK